MSNSAFYVSVFRLSKLEDPSVNTDITFLVNMQDTVMPHSPSFMLSTRSIFNSPLLFPQSLPIFASSLVLPVLGYQSERRDPIHPIENILRLTDERTSM